MRRFVFIGCLNMLVATALPHHGHALAGTQRQNPRSAGVARLTLPRKCSAACPDQRQGCPRSFEPQPSPSTGQGGRTKRSCRPAHKPYSASKTVTVHPRLSRRPVLPMPKNWLLDQPAATEVFSFIRASRGLIKMCLVRNQAQPSSIQFILSDLPVSIFSTCSASQPCASGALVRMRSRLCCPCAIIVPHSRAKNAIPFS